MTQNNLINKPLLLRFLFVSLSVCLLFLIFQAYIYSSERDNLLPIRLQKWVVNHPEISIAFDGYFPPYSYLDEQGKLIGYSVDLIHYISRKAKLKFKVHPEHHWRELYQLATNKQIDVVATMVNKVEREPFFEFTQPYIFKSLAIATRDDFDEIENFEQLKNIKIALVQSYNSTSQFLKQQPLVNPVYVDDIASALELLAAGKVDAAMGYISAIDYFIDKRLLTNIKINTIWAANDANESFAIRKDWSELKEIIDIVLSHMTPAEKEEFADKWLIKEQYKVENNQLKKWLTFAMLLLIVISAITLIIWKLWRVLQITNQELNQLKNNLEQQVKERTQKLFKLSYEDRITGLANRNAFYKTASKILESHHLQQQSFALVVLTINRFKNINDTLGHEAGNEALKLVASRILRFAESENFVFRFGGDEFGLIITNTERESSLAVVRQLLADLQEEYFVADTVFSLSFSVGIVFYPDDGSTIDKLYQHAEIAMFRAKQHKTGLELFIHDDSESFTHLVNLEQSLLTAIKKLDQIDADVEFSLRYQPIKWVHQKGVKSFEVLTRWQQHQQNMVSPEIFFKLAEELNQIARLSSWIRQSAFKQALIWQQQGVHFQRLSINVSGVELQLDSFLNDLKRQVQQLGFHFNWLEIEVTETAILKNPQKAITVLNECKKLGATISIDDFGTGYASLLYLKQIPADVVKIDREFVKNLPNKTDEGICQYIIQMCHLFNKIVVAEGVETLEQYQLLKSFGVDCIQGYIVAKPLTAEQILPELPFFAQTTDNLL